MTTYRHTDEIKAANKAHGNHWFDKETMDFFASRLYGSVHYGRYFISSEVPPHSRRRFTIRVASENGAIDTIGDFCQFATYKAASTHLDRLIKTNQLPAYADGIIDDRQGARPP
jgi:hypothetical protein